MNEFKVNVYYDEKKSNIEKTMLIIFRDFIKSKLSNFENKNEVYCNTVDKEKNFVKVREEI